jgi:hypothetical protein
MRAIKPVTPDEAATVWRSSLSRIGKPAHSGFGAYFMANPTTVQAKVDTNTLLANTSGKNSPQLRLRQGA